MFFSLLTIKVNLYSVTSDESRLDNTKPRLEKGFSNACGKGAEKYQDVQRNSTFSRDYLIHVSVTNPTSAVLECVRLRVSANKVEEQNEGDADVEKQ